ncbi:hypothetical protein C8Q77DRAFT_1077724 [Trametes polyzona]|nr:hypothetical protein C8Q77DRAFT_1077724 [Trametes polyzona]
MMLPDPLESPFGARSEQASADKVEATAGSSSPPRPASLLPPFSAHKISHLPTPQSSPSNVAQYAPERNHSLASPVSSLNRDAPAPHVAVSHRAATPLREEPQAVSAASFMTPESSPVFPRKVMPPGTPHADPASVPHTPLRNHPESSEAGSSRMAVDAAVPPLAPAPIITTPVSTHSRGLTPASRLSSPFRDKSSDRRPTKSQSRSPMPPHTDDSPMTLDISTSTLAPSSPPPLVTPVPQRPLGGEIHRIRLQLAADHAEHQSEKEARRPDYLVREKRPRPDDDDADALGDAEADIPTLEELDAASAVAAALGVTESPIKGRRLQLFQATSEETFEQSLLAGGYPGYGQSPGYKAPEPQTPVPKGGRTALSQRALRWLHQATPGQPGPSTAVVAEEPVQEDPEWVPSEKEMRKRRRLELFKEKPDAKDSPGSKLYAVEVEGRGRLLLNVPPEGTPAQAETPVKKRAVRRRKRKGGRRGAHGKQEEDDGEPLEPNWPDSAFPWCMRVQERSEAAKMEQEERLRWIERFLDRESESDEEEEDQLLRPPLQSHENDQVAHRRGRGKMVPLRANPEARHTQSRDENMLVPSDPADARAALLSKRSVRALAFRRQSLGETDGEDVVCIGCMRGDDGSELVQCDECQTWYHLRCIGIKTIAELGREEDPWYCDRCLDIHPASPMPEPTFVPTDDRPIGSTARRESLFLQNHLLESPAPHWDSEPRAPQTPVRGSDDSSNADHTFSTRSSWGDSSRAGPSTPESSEKTVRVYHTPGPFTLERDQLDPETPFDPTTTPSRGIKFSGGPPPTLGLSTPRGGFGLWAGRGGQTPTPGAKFGGASAWRHGYDEGPSPHMRSIYSVGFDDTPVTRAPQVGSTAAAMQGRRLWDTPGFARPTSPSPQARGELEEAMETEA